MAVDIVVSGINLPLTSGSSYGVDFSCKSITAIVYLIKTMPTHPGGNGFWIDDGLSWIGYSYLDLQFRAEFGPSAVSEPATMLFVGSGLVALLGIRRKMKK